MSDVAGAAGWTSVFGNHGTVAEGRCARRDLGRGNRNAGERERKSYSRQAVTTGNDDGPWSSVGQGKTENVTSGRDCHILYPADHVTHGRGMHRLARLDVPPRR